MPQRSNLNVPDNYSGHACDAQNLWTVSTRAFKLSRGCVLKLFLNQALSLKWLKIESFSCDFLQFLYTKRDRCQSWKLKRLSLIIRKSYHEILARKILCRSLSDAPRALAPGKAGQHIQLVWTKKIPTSRKVFPIFQLFCLVTGRVA